jgi:hypothetical protein
LLVLLFSGVSMQNSTPGSGRVLDEAGRRGADGRGLRAGQGQRGGAEQRGTIARALMALSVSAGT